MYTFITTLAVFCILLTGARIFGVLTNNDPDTANLVRMAETLGYTPINDALKMPVIVFIVSAAWLVSLFFN